MKVSANLTDLPKLHSRLHWSSIIAATVAVLKPLSTENSVDIRIEVENCPTYDDSELSIEIDLSKSPKGEVAKVKRTHEPARLVEMAAIAIGALVVYHIGRHTIYRAAISGSRADYLLDQGKFLLEISGRSRKSDFEPAWKGRRNRLRAWADRGWYLFVVEFETLSGRIAFAKRGK